MESAIYTKQNKIETTNTLFLGKNQSAANLEKIVNLQLIPKFPIKCPVYKSFTIYLLKSSNKNIKWTKLCKIQEVM